MSTTENLYSSPMAAALAVTADQLVDVILQRIGAPADGPRAGHDGAVHALRLEVLELLARHLVRAAAMPLTGSPYSPPEHDGTF